MSVFKDYDLLAASGLFDAGYYRDAHPDVRDSNVDPLLHYLEHGAAEGRSPLPGFDAVWYLRQCEAHGERPQNPLIHYITTGAQRGFRLMPAARDEGVRAFASSSPEPAPNEQLLYIDIPRVVSGAAEAPVKGGLSIAGWAVARAGVRTIEVAVDGKLAAVAHHGIRRPDVAAQFSEWDDALQSGYSAHVPPKALQKGPHTITVTLHDHGGSSVSQQFRVQVEEIPDDSGPWALRRKMSHTETLYELARLQRLGCVPQFAVVLEAPVGWAVDEAALRRTLDTLARQTYPHWQLHVAAESLAEAVHRACEGAMAELRERLASALPSPAAVLSQPNAPLWVLPVRVGDEYSCDALLSIALAAAQDERLRYIYGDDRRSRIDGEGIEACFKPQWSPELLECSNYIGRAWAVRADALAAADLDITALLALPDYTRVLRLAEACNGKRSDHLIGHVPRVLMQQAALTAAPVDDAAHLREWLQQRGETAEVLPGRVDGTHHLSPVLASEPRVSIIIPTCAAKGLIQSCLESLRTLTRYRNYEIVCIENIPSERRDWKQWLRAQADCVVETAEPFNWSRFNNLAAAQATGELLLFLNDDIEVIDADWLHALVAYAQRPAVGVVGAQLLYPDRSVQHAGVMLDEEGRGRHAFRHLDADEPGYFGLALTPRNVISVTGACLMVRREVYEAVGRFDEAHTVINNDLDFCLRVWQHGLRNVYTPYARLIHHELVSRAHIEERYDTAAFRRSWQALITAGDPYFNPNLSREHEAFTIEREPLQRLHAGHPVYDRDAIRRILVVKLDHIGDCVTSLPALRRLRQHFPKARISVLAGASTLSVWKLEPAVDEVIEFSFFNARSGLGKLERSEDEYRALRDRLQPLRFDLAIDLRKQPDTRAVLQYSGAQWLAGYDHQGRFPWLDMALEWDEDVPLRAKRTHVADDLTALIDAIAAYGLQDRGHVAMPESSAALDQLAQRGVFNKPLICVHPASGSSMRQWPLQSFAQVVAQLLAEDSHHIAVIGGPDERSFADQLLAALDARERNSPALFDLVGALKLGELPALLARAALFVGNNSGPQHLAAALGVPTLGIHSAVVDSIEWAPLGERGVAVRRSLSCSPCYIERPADCPRMLACMTDIHPNSIYRQAMSMLDAPRPVTTVARLHAATLAETV